jgi:hypothetical protein
VVGDADGGHVAFGAHPLVRLGVLEVCWDVQLGGDVTLALPGPGYLADYAPRGLCDALS